MAMALNKKALAHQTRGELSDYVFKVRGREEYLVGNIPLIKFVYIQESLAWDLQPTLIVVNVNSVPGLFVSFLLIIF